MFNKIIQAGIKNVWELDCKEQSNFLSIIAEVREMDVNALEGLGAFFVPNDDYLALRFGEIVREWEFDCYYEDKCKWTGCLVLPVWGIGGIKALAGFNPFQYVKNREQSNWSTPYYQYSSHHVFKKGRFVWAPPDKIEHAIVDGYVFIVDGLFDAISLNHAGFHAWALMDSSVTQERVTLMRFVKRVILIADNDSAGTKLYQQLSKRINQLELWKQDYSKDIDELLKSKYRNIAIKDLQEILCTTPISIRKASFKNLKENT